MFYFSQKSKQRLNGVHPDLVKVVNLALKKSKVDFTVLEGLRTLARQRVLVRQGASQTLNSNHRVQKTGYGHAVDLIPYPVSWNITEFYPFVEAMREAAKELNVKVRWGGSWDVLNNTTSSPKALVDAYAARKRKAGQKAFIDGAHFELWGY